ncbi:ABC transporter ATP-binding protein [Methyloterricola oryzae]|uniref:ABC transporter ATP-binding protein n=1 Tax=Methyloterricola oryzae TaxID=1495050 RepID=UPI0009E57550|nr:ABC transporter ATP-binding protein [Methyloterricola oryzae]
MYQELPLSCPSPDAVSFSVDSARRLLLKDVHWGYEEAGVWREVLKGVDLDVQGGEQIAILGQSGCGKSSLLHLIGALDQPSAGHIAFGATDLTGLAEPGRSLWRRRHVGFIYQFFNLIPTLTVLENVLLPLELNGLRNREASAWALDLLSEVGLAERADAYPDRLSGGEQQRVAMVRALVHKPDLVLADEPTGNLDLETGEKVLDILDRLVRAQGHTLLLVTHSIEVAKRAGRIFRLADGKLFPSD